MLSFPICRPSTSHTFSLFVPSIELILRDPLGPRSKHLNSGAIIRIDKLPFLIDLEFALRFFPLPLLAFLLFPFSGCLFFPIAWRSNWDIFLRFLPVFSCSFSFWNNLDHFLIWFSCHINCMHLFQNFLWKPVQYQLFQGFTCQLSLIVIGLYLGEHIPNVSLIRNPLHFCKWFISSYLILKSQRNIILICCPGSRERSIQCLLFPLNMPRLSIIRK